MACVLYNCSVCGPPFPLAFVTQCTCFPCKPPHCSTRLAHIVYLCCANAYHVTAPSTPKYLVLLGPLNPHLHPSVHTSIPTFHPNHRMASMSHFPPSCPVCVGSLSIPVRGCLSWASAALPPPPYASAARWPCPHGWHCWAPGGA